MVEKSVIERLKEYQYEIDLLKHRIRVAMNKKQLLLTEEKCQSKSKAQKIS